MRNTGSSRPGLQAGLAHDAPVGSPCGGLLGRPAFASRHISMSFTAALAAHLLGLGRRLRTALWIWFAVTTAATIYLGWHYVLDDVGGVVLGAIALAAARALTGIDLRKGRRRRRATGPVGTAASNGGDGPASRRVPDPATLGLRGQDMKTPR